MAGSSDCTMSFNKWQKLIAVNTGKAAPVLVTGGSATLVWGTLLVCHPSAVLFDGAHTVCHTQFPIPGKGTNMTAKTIPLFLFVSFTAATQPIVIKTGTLIDGLGHVSINTQIAIEGSVIKSVTHAKGKPTYDLSGFTVLLSLIHI